MRLRYVPGDALAGMLDELAGHKAKHYGPAYGFGRLYAKSRRAMEYAGTRRDRDAEEDAQYCAVRMEAHGIDLFALYSTASAPMSLPAPRAELHPRDELEYLGGRDPRKDGGR